MICKIVDFAVLPTREGKLKEIEINWDIYIENCQRTEENVFEDEDNDFTYQYQST